MDTIRWQIINNFLCQINFFFHSKDSTRKLAVYIDAEVQVRNGAVVISSSTEKVVAPDGSLHNITVINSRTLGRTINGEEAE